MTPTIHASAILFGYRGILIRGPSGSGKSRLALALLQSRSGFAQLVADDRVHLEAVHGRLLMRPARRLEGLIEIRGAGIVRLPFEPVATASVVIDLGIDDAPRLPASTDLETRIEGIPLARLPVAPSADALALSLAFLTLGASGGTGEASEKPL